ncbi:hypothetical protein WIW50_10240 [Flavobacteriaceae bacterium 3-367]|uniref:hypothetical protein n=1 Tax=Eudoraea algarum TaxID=3417568 RepID=UPI003268BC0C
MQPISIQAASNSLLILRVNLISNIIAPAVIQPNLDHWVRNDGTIYEADYGLEPVYSFLQTGGEAKLTFSIQLPKNLKKGNVLYGALNVPSSETYVFPIEIEVVSRTPKTKKAYHHTTRITIPPISLEEDQPPSNSVLVSKSTIKLLAGLASLEVIPSKWIVSELVLSCCNLGYKYAITKNGSEALESLSRTRFFKNGVLIFQGTQFVQWIKLALSISSGINAFAEGKPKEAMILQHWEEWLFNLVDQDVESPEFKYREVAFPTPKDYKKVLDVMANDTEKWFSYFILGLGKLSPRIETVLKQLIEKVELPPPTKPKPKTKSRRVLKEKGSIMR